MAPPYAAQATTARNAGLGPDSVDDQTKFLQAAVDRAAERRMPLALAAERYHAAGLKLQPRTMLSGSCGAATIVLATPGAIVQAESAERIMLHAISFVGDMLETGNAAMALVSLKNCACISICRIELKASGGRGAWLESCSGRVSASRLSTIEQTTLFALHNTGLDITDNTVTDCGNDGIQMWRSQDGEDGSIVARKLIVLIFARSGGSRQNGNGINVFRAGGVRLGGNRITDSAVRGNLVRREFEPVDKCGGGIAVEADARVIGDTVENAPTAGMVS